MQNNLVSIIVPLYNRAHLLPKLFACIENQTYPHLELVLVDDGSTDAPETSIRDYPPQRRVPLQFLRQANAGPGAARRLGLEHAQGEYIQYLDSDDEILPDKIEKQVHALKHDPEAVMAWTTTKTVDAQGRTGIRKLSDQPSADLLATALQWRRWHTSSCLWRYPDRSKVCWLNLYNGEDVVHDVSVGVHWRHTVFLAEPLTVSFAYDDTLWTGKPSEHYRDGVTRCPEECLVLLGRAQMQHLPIYTAPLTERFYHVGCLMARVGDRPRMTSSLKNAVRLAPTWPQRMEARAAFLLLNRLWHHSNIMSRLLWRLHRRLTPYTRHVGRGIGC
jgi:glycosyltransferase involved in cell wall biosynthesis